MRRYSWILPAVAVLALALPLTANAKDLDTESPTLSAGPDCNTTDYKNESQSFVPAFPIPDAGSAVVGVLPTLGDGSVITDVILEVVMNHTWVGDLVLRLDYVDCGSGVPLAGTNVLCRPRGTGATTPGPCGTGTGFGCSGDLGTGGATGTPVPYRWSDAALAPIAEGVCPAVTAPGCYKPAVGNAMAIFNGRLKGGCWVLSVADHAAADIGTISSWTVWMDNETPVPTRIASWGSVKTIYR